MPEIIAHISSLSVLAPLAVYFAKFKRSEKLHHLIGALLLLSAVSDLAGFLLFNAGESTAVVFNTYYVLLFLLLSWFYYEIVQHKRIQSVIMASVGIYLFAFVLISVYVQDFFFYQNIMWAITAALMILYSISYFLYSLSTIATTDIFLNSFTWINSGILFYFSFNLSLFMMTDYLFNKADPHVSLLVWSFHNVNNIIKNILFTIGMTMIGRQLFKIEVK